MSISKLTGSNSDVLILMSMSTQPDVKRDEGINPCWKYFSEISKHTANDITRMLLRMAQSLSTASGQTMST